MQCDPQSILKTVAEYDRSPKLTTTTDECPPIAGRRPAVNDGVRDLCRRVLPRLVAARDGVHSHRRKHRIRRLEKRLLELDQVHRMGCAGVHLARVPAPAATHVPEAHDCG